MVGLCLVAMFAISAVVVASASATLPEFQVENYKTYKSEPLNKPIKFKESSEGVTIKQGTTTLTCTSSTGKGKLTGPKTLTLQTKYKGCEEPETHAPCQSGKKPREIKTNMLAGTLMYASASEGGSPVVAVSMHAEGVETGSMTSYTCGSTKVALSGPVLGEVTLASEPTMDIKVTYAEGAEPEPGCGKQELQFVGGVGPCLHLVVHIGSASEEPGWIVAADKKEIHCHCGVSILK
jgi:hypothetical protein